MSGITRCLGLGTCTNGPQPPPVKIRSTWPPAIKMKLHGDCSCPVSLKFAES
jgi:hypothetical protein